MREIRCGLYLLLSAAMSRNQVDNHDLQKRQYGLEAAALLVATVDPSSIPVESPPTLRGRHKTGPYRNMRR